MRVLEEFLDDWPGALVVVSHDRAFLERTVTDVLIVDGTGWVGRRAGGYAAWEDERRAARPGPRARAVSVGGGTRAPAGSAATASAATGSAARLGGARSPSTLRQLMKETDKELAALHRRHDVLETELKDASADHAALRSIGVELAEVSAAVAAVEERWLALAEEADSARGNP